MPGLFEGGVEDQFATGGGAEPGVIYQLLLQLPGIPTRIAQANQGLLRAFTNGDGFENVTAGGQDQAITEDSAGVPAGGGTVQHKAGFLLDRPTGHHAMPLGGRHFDFNIHVAEDIAKADLHRAVERQPHGALAAVLNDIGNGMFKVRVSHLWHGHQQLVLQGCVFHGDSIRGGKERCKLKGPREGQPGGISYRSRGRQELEDPARPDPSSLGSSPTRKVRSYR